MPICENVHISSYLGIFQMTAAAAAAAATASQELSPFGKTPGVPRAGTKYPVQGNPSLRFGKTTILRHALRFFVVISCIPFVSFPGSRMRPSLALSLLLSFPLAPSLPFSSSPSLYLSLVLSVFDLFIVYLLFLVLFSFCVCFFYFIKRCLFISSN